MERDVQYHTGGDVGESETEANSAASNSTAGMLYASRPRLVRSLFQRDVTVVKVAAGSHHTACMSQEGELYTFGLNSSGQCRHHYHDTYCDELSSDTQNETGGIGRRGRDGGDGGDGGDGDWHKGQQII